MSDSDLLQLVREAFVGVPRPEHFTDYTHCEECQEHDELMRSRDLQSLTVQDVENPGWNPICFLTPEGFRYYLPAFIRLALSAEGADFLSEFAGFHLAMWDEQFQARCAALNKQQKEAVLKFLCHIRETRADFFELEMERAELDLAIKRWNRVAQ